MSGKVKNASKVDPALDKAIDKLLKEVTLDAKGDDGKQKYSLTDVCKVVDRKLKLEAIKSRTEDAGFGSAFGDDKENE